jgi:alkylhydroperoxidase family enzyme
MTATSPTTSSTTAARLAATLADHPDVADALAAAHDSVWRAVDPVLLELARLRIAMLLGCEEELATRTPSARAAGLDEATIVELANWPRSSRFGDRERACLELAEQFVIDVAGVTTAQTAAVITHLGVGGLTDFTSGLLVLEQRQRLILTWARLLGRSTS